MATRREILQIGAATAGLAACKRGASPPARSATSASGLAALRVKKSDSRGQRDLGWLKARFSFSFANYVDPDNMNFRSLRVLNEDRIQPGGGFPLHPHRDMEIITYVLSGALQHKDTLGNGSIIRPFEIQRMTAGRGIYHSEFNHAKQSGTVHLLQIWLTPDQRGLPPAYEQKRIPARLRSGLLRLIASPTGSEGSIRINQDAMLYSSCLDGRQRVAHQLGRGRHAWLQVARGQLTVNGHALGQGDAAASTSAGRLEIESRGASEFLLFDLA